MIRKAKLKDAEEILNLINFWAKKGKVLRRSLNYIYENLRDFWVWEEKRRIVGVCSLHIVGWKDLAEIKCLVVKKNFQKRGIGRSLVEICLKEAEELGIKKVFALSFEKKFFEKLGFKRIDKKRLPSKIWGECINCIYFPSDCKEEAFIKKIA